MIDPSFTPVELVDASRRIVAGKLEEDKEQDRWVVTETRVLKGKSVGSLHISLGLPGAKDAKEVRELLRSCLGGQAMVFEGGFVGFVTGFMVVGTRSPSALLIGRL